MHRSILLLAPLALAACSSSQPADNETASPSATPTIAPANATDPGTVDAALVQRTPPKPGAFKTFGDWVVGCDNIKTCTMASLAPEESTDFPPINMAITRTAGPAGALTVTLNPNDGLAPKAAPTGVAIDGHQVGGTFGRGDAPSVTGDGARAIAAAMVNGHTLAITSDAGKRLSTLSLKGASAALRYIDAAQGRAGTVTAIVATGAQSAAGVPAGPAVPQIQAVVPVGQAFQPTKAMIAAMKKQAQCDDTAFGEVESHAIGGSTSVILVPCGSGAYNMIAAVFVAKNGEVSPARMDAPSGITEDGSTPVVPTVVNAEVSDGALSSYAKGRGLGDCGVMQRFVWDGTMFRLSHQEEMPECRGDPNYITTWTTRVSRR